MATTDRPLSVRAARVFSLPVIMLALGIFWAFAALEIARFL